MSKNRPWWLCLSALVLAALAPGCTSEETSEDAESSADGSGESGGGADAGAGSQDCESESDCSTAGGGGEDGGSEPDGAGCADDSDCAPTEFCAEGECVPVPSGRVCSEDADCSTGEICEGGECVSDPEFLSCESDDDCPTNEICDGSGVCVPGEEPQPCTDSFECPGDSTCEEGICVSPEDQLASQMGELLSLCNEYCQAACLSQWGVCSEGSEDRLEDCQTACDTRNTRFVRALGIDDTSFECATALADYSLCRADLTCEQFASEAAGTAADACSPAGPFSDPACTALGL